MGNQKRVAGAAISIAVIMVESMIPELSPWIGLPVVALCVCALIVSLAPERVRSVAHAVPRIAPALPHIDKLIDWVVGIDLNDTAVIPGYEAIRLYCEARPNSDETTAINLADSARLGELRSWGRPRPKEALPGHIPAPEQIPPDVWAYAVLDAGLIYGPMPQSSMTYRKQYVKPYLEDDRLLYDAVRFSKREVIELCRRASISASKKPANSGS